MVKGLRASLAQLGMTNVTISPPIVNRAELLQAADQQQGSLLLVGRSCPLLDDAALESLVEDLDCPIGIV